MVKKDVTSIQQLFLDNRLFFRLFVAFMAIGGAMLMFIEQGDSIFFFSSHRSPLGDQFFIYGSHLGEAAGYVFILILMLTVAYRYVFTLPVLAIVVTLVSFYTKDFFAHLRPGNYYDHLGILDQINTIDGVILNMGANSFPSGHTMSGFALYAFAAFCMPNKKSWTVLFFSIALIVGISRIYLVQHFFKDVYLGAIMGVAIAIILYLVQARLGRDNNHWLNKNLMKPQNRKTAKIKT